MDNIYAHRLGRAAMAARAGGDLIDHGWSLLKALDAEGFDVMPRREVIEDRPYCGPSLNITAGLHGED